MKTSIQLAASVVALTGLLVGAASQATPLSELPLKASVLAKPNVILGMDDSGSMDSEIMLDAADGVMWWNFDTGRGWDTAGVLYRHVNLGEYWSSTWRRYFYLFPNGNGTGLNIKPENTYGDWSLPPTSQFGWARSSAYNPQYYNPTVTYPEWATAYTYAAFPQATPSAARGHPIYGGGGNVVDLTTTRAASQSTSLYFTAVNGMTIPAGATSNVCDTSIGGCGGWTAVGAADVAAQSTKVTKVAMSYWPATYWVRATGTWDCTVPGTPSVGTDSCALAPDGQKLRRIEIRSTVTTYPSGRTYTAELQNFANWFQYHRKRRLSANGAMGETLEAMTGLRMGIIRMNSLPADSTRVTMYDLDSTSAANNGKAILKNMYEIDSNVGTPTRPLLRRIGHEFLQSAGPIQYACQRNVAMIVTDGYASAAAQSTSTYPTYSSATWGAGAPYATTYSGTLADIALSYYTTTLGNSSFPTGRLPPGTTDTNTNLHMNTYALTLGAMGDLYRGETTPNPTTTGAWVNPNTDFNPSAVDDLWHATINGRGKLYLASAASETANKLLTAFNDIQSQNFAQGSVAVSAVNLDRSDSQAYLGVYNPRGWAGDLTANPIDITTAAVSSTPNWSAATVLAAKAWSTRVIFTSNASAGIDFSSANIGATVNPDTATFTDNNAVVEYLRGNRTGEGTTYRTRNSLIGAVVNAEPVLARDERMVYLASGDGMLHALDTATGAEQWAYAPPDTLAALGRSIERGWVFQTVLDASPVYARLSNGNKLLVGGLGAAGRSYYALDVTSPRGLDTAGAIAQFRWIFPTAADTANRANMGFTVGRPVIARTAADGNVVLVTSGYDNAQAIGDSRGRLWVLNATTGAVIRSFRTTAGAVHPGQEAGLTQVSAFKESDGTTRYVYGGDLRGNLWKFDLTRVGTDLDAELLATLLDAGGLAQPVTTAPELTTVAGQRVVLVGTGRLLDIGDFGSSNVQSFYAIADGATLTNARSGLIRQTYTRATDTMSTNTVNWTTNRGWYFDLTAGEQSNTDPTVAYGAVAFVTNVNGASDCSQSAYMYLIDIGTGTKVSTSTFVSQTIATNATSSRVIALRVVNGRIIGTTHRSDNTVYQREMPVGQTIQPAKNAWREIRR